MTSKTKLATLGIAGLLALTGLAACGDDDDDDGGGGGEVAEANAEFCADLTDYATALGDLAALDPSAATKDDYEAAAETVRETREAMVESAADLSAAEWEALEQEADALRDQLADAPDDAAVADILAEAQPQAAQVLATSATVNTAICTTTTGPTTS